jgi:hypothetical protein
VGRTRRNWRRSTYSTAPLTSRTRTRVGRSSTQVGQATRPAVNSNCGGPPAMRPTPRRGLLCAAAQNIIRPEASDRQMPSPTRRRAVIDGHRAGPVRIDGVGATRERRHCAASPLRYLTYQGSGHLDMERASFVLHETPIRGVQVRYVFPGRGSSESLSSARPSRRARLGAPYCGSRNSAGNAAG